ncbi:MAG: TetR/AcrR family transcriptional regulator [Pseudomonadota bacterium]
MPRPKSKSQDQLVTAAMQHFWAFGFGSTSMDELVSAIGTSRHAIYTECGGKNELFLLCLQAYQETVVSPAFESVEAEGADISAIETYFEAQIERAEAMGPPYPGCLIANTTAETASQTPKVVAAIEHHNARLKAGFRNAILNTDDRETGMSDVELDQLAEFLAISAQGLWLFSKSVKEVGVLRHYARTLTSLIEKRIKG